MQFDFDTPVNRNGIGNMKASFLDSQESDMLNLSGAEIDFATAPVIQNALVQLAAQGIYGFTLPDLDYKDSIRWWMKNVRHYDIPSEIIVPTLGTISALNTAIRTFTQPGDGVIIQHPSYYRFDRAILRNHRKVISNSMIEENGVYSIDFRDLADKMACPENRMLVLCNPHNPTGRVFSSADIERIAELADHWDVIVFSDEIFAEVTFDGHEVIPYISIDKTHGITSTSLGKSFSLTGVNHANLLIPDPILRDRFIQQRDIDHFGSIDPFFYSALRAAYTEQGAQWITAMNHYVWENYCILKKGLEQRTPTISVSPLEGTYVVWLDCRKLGLNDCELQVFMQNNVRLLADPGIEYGALGSGFYRLNLATNRQTVYTLLDHLDHAINQC